MRRKLPGEDPLNPRMYGLVLGLVDVLSIATHSLAKEAFVSTELIEATHQLPAGPNQHLGNYHYVTTNEDRHDLVAPLIQDLDSTIGRARLHVHVHSGSSWTAWAAQ